MATINPTPARDFTWNLGDAEIKGQLTEVWQRCRSCDRFDLDEATNTLTTPDGRTARLPGFWDVKVPQDIRRCLVVSRVSQSLVGVTLRLPDLDIDIEHSVVADLPPLTSEQIGDLTSTTNLT